MQAFLLINTIFKTTEYKLDTSSNLEITELSISGVKSKTVLLNSLNVSKDQSSPSFLSWLILLMGCASSLVVLHLSKESALLYNNLLNIIFFLSCVYGSLWLVSRPEKCHVYTDCFTNNVLFKLKKPLTVNKATESFIKDLDTAIDSAKTIDSNVIHLNSNARLQFEIHNKNVNDLMNSGMIDEMLYKRICNSMHENVFGSINEHPIDNVVYLHR